MPKVLAVLAAVAVALPMHADDGAASISAGGLVAVREPRITMAKEVLSLSLKRVAVDYDFRNDTDAPVTTEIAFPIPAYTNDIDGADPKRAGFDDFKLAVDGRPVAFQTEVKAIVKGRDVTPLLLKNGIEPATFGHYDSQAQASRDLMKLTPAQMRELVAAGAINRSPEATDATWTVQKRYHWTQTFPAHGTVHIRHEYTPVVGQQLVPGEYLQPSHRVTADEKSYVGAVTSLCLSPAQMRAAGSLGKGVVATEWVDFILTTANSWKQPIGDFTLIVERTDPKETVSFCWDGPVVKLDANRFQAHTTNLVPKKELHIGFYSLNRAQ